ncbi:MAG: GyrI-like domain-containing protein [Candidatus Cohnella colombiensis]|uniref:GyrI-like domain-containing protein n=1 Tax=Candidatus Cohnella colombiensis TaxID=3121368 RepID=A0AA95JAK1_9BACL|nr:MAG: GyrI-like domain-containing protein [Cohnella sp.]
MEEVFKYKQPDSTLNEKVLSNVITKDSFTLVGYRIAVPFSELGKNVRGSVSQIYGRLELLTKRLNKDIICLIPPQTLDPQLPVLFVGIEMAGQFNVPEGMEALVVPGQKYVIATFKGTLDQYGQFQQSIPDAITGAGLEPVDMWQGYTYEVYPESAYNWSDDGAIQEIRLHWTIKE